MSEIDGKKAHDSKKRELGVDDVSNKDSSSNISKKMKVLKNDVVTTDINTISLSLDFPEMKQLHHIVVAKSKGSAGCLQTENSPSTYILAMVTNDVAHQSKMNKEKESAFTIINYVPIKILDGVGYHKAPYEKVEGSNTKQLVYFDKKGKIIPGTLNSTLATAVMVDGTKSLDWKTWNPHPTGMMKNKWRGLPTDVIGTISPGVPLSNFIFDEQKENTMHDSMTEDKLKPFTLAIIGIVVRSNEQCDRGYGISIKTIKHVSDINAGMSGLYEKKWFYNDATEINNQTLDLLAKSGRTKIYNTDLFFVSKLVRGSNNDKVTERPLVYIDLQSKISKNHQHKIYMQPNNKTLELEFVCEGSIYNNKRFRVTIPENAFTLEETGLSWVQTYYQWCLDCNMASILIIHNDYQVQKMAEGGNYVNVECCIVPNENAMFACDNMKMEISSSIQKNLLSPTDNRFQSIDINTENKKDFAGSVMSKNSNNHYSYGIIIDKSRPRIPKSADNEVLPDDDANQNNGWKHHTSAVCRLYSGMDVSRHVWCAYLVVFDDSKMISVLPVGLQANKSPQFDSLLSSPVDVNIYQNPNVFLS